MSRIASRFKSTQSFLAPARRFSTASVPHFTYSRTYRGPLQCAILDWSGTVADNWVIAPAYAFVKVFEKHGVKITMNQARGPMGLRKDLHIAALCQQADVRAEWTRVKGKTPTQQDVDAMFKDFVPLQLDCLRQFTGLIPGAKDVVNQLRNKHQLKIGSTTGFQRVMVDVLLKDAEKQGLKLDTTVAGDEVSMPRPYPYMVFKNMEKLGILNSHAVVKVDDTTSGVGEGLNAGCWAVGLSHTSNYMNINSYEERKQMSKEEYAERGAKCRELLLKTGCHFVIDDITGLPAVVEEINSRLARGHRP
jgi:phosphonoacetaldehyde hydrolase